MHTLREQLKNFDWSLKSIVKASLALLVVVVALALVLGIVSSVARSVFGYNLNDDGAYYGGSGNFIERAFNKSFSSDGGALDSYAVSNAREHMAVQDLAFSEERFLPPLPPAEGGPDAEEYERRDYSAHYETRQFDETCGAIAELKPFEYVVFDNSTKTEDWCNYNFRVDVAYEDDVVAKLQALDPRNFNVNTSTIDRSIEYHDSELAMQQRRLTSTQQTLTQAEASFNSLIAKATRDGDTKTLSEVINNKINTIDRLNQQLLDTQERIDRLTKGRGDQIEQVEYAHFNVSVSKLTFFDNDQFVDEWKRRVQELFATLNETLLALTLGLVLFVLGAIKVIVFATFTIIGVTVFAKAIWVVVKRIWFWRRG